MSDAKVYTPADIQTALKERLVKFEQQLKDLHARELRKDEHQEPGIHEADQGQSGHMEPGGHENAVLPMPQSPSEQPVGSSSGIPPGQLQDLCPMCGKPDQPGQCVCLNGGGHEGLDHILDAAQGVPATPLHLSEAVFGKQVKKSEDLCKEHSAKMCKACMSKATDFVDVDGKLKSKGIEASAELPPGDDQVLPQKKKSKEASSPDDNDPKKNPLGKAGPPMAKPPSGGPAGAVAPPPAAKAAAPKVGGPAGGPKAVGKAEEKSKKPVKPKPVVMVAQPDAERKSELSKSMGACLFCGNREHEGRCGLAKNIQVSLAKAVSAITQPIPKLKAKAAGMHTVGNTVTGSAPKPGSEDKTKATPGRAAAVAPTQIAKPPAAPSSISSTSKKPFAYKAEKSMAKKKEQTPKSEETPIGKERSKGGIKEESSRKEESSPGDHEYR